MKRKSFLIALLMRFAVGVLWFSKVNAESDFVHYETIDGVDTITVCDVNDSTKCITMMDRNLWATKAGTWCSATDTWACGYHYQRWNNYWFAPNFNSNGTFPNGETATTNETVDTTWYWPWNFYSGNIFRKITSSPYDWSTTRNDNLRWWAEDSESNNRRYDETNNVVYNVTWRQWPCPDWYHVPSIWELNTVLKYWAEENGIELEGNSDLKYNWELNWSWYKFQEDFKIPFAGYRHNNANVYGIGVYADLRSSSPSVGNGLARGFCLDPNKVSALSSVSRANAYSVRCFKDSALGFPSAASQVMFWTGEVAGEPACSGEVLSWEVVSWDLLTCVQWLWDSKQWYTLSGWKNVEADAVWTLDTPVVTWLTLQAIWTPNTDSNNNWIADEEESFIITREDGDGNFVWSGEFAYGVSPAFGGTQPEKTGYIFSSRDPAVQSVTGDFTYTATWTANEYTITFDTDWWSAINPITWNYNEPITAPSNPTKAGAVFDSWSPAFPATMPLGWATLKAIWRNALSGGWSAWWGWVKKEIDDCPNGDYSSSYYDWTCGSKDSSSNDDNLSSWANAKDIDTTEWLESNELQTAYERAVQNNIVDTNYIDNIWLQTSLTRIEMARILSRYAINILWEIPDETKTKNFADVSDYLDKLYDYSVSTSYQLWIMWINLPDDNFRPNDSVPRAEFATALSRMLYDTPDWQDEYWSTHINSLYNSWIITNTDPDLTETVWYVLIMLMRSVDSR